MAKDTLNIRVMFEKMAFKINFLMVFVSDVFTRFLYCLGDDVAFPVCHPRTGHIAPRIH